MGPPSVSYGRKIASVQIQRVEVERLKREECQRVKHDKLFSDWKLLVGALDWKAHAAAEEGSQKYRLHNLPSNYFGPGVYELGLTLQSVPSFPQSAKQRRIRRQNVIVVYLGQAENIRHRLQTYGQSGSHLEGSKGIAPSMIQEVKFMDEEMSRSSQNVGSKGDVRLAGSERGGLRLFTEVFSRGYSVVFRWAKTESKQMAEKVETELLRFFDYPWNRGLNGARRPEDIMARLELMQFHLEKSVCIGRYLTVSSEVFHRRVGVKVSVKRPSEDDREGSSKHSVFHFKLKPGSVESQLTAGVLVCGVLTNDGIPCSNFPVKDRRRCSDHKGFRAKMRTGLSAKGPAAKAPNMLSRVTNTDHCSADFDGQVPPVLVVKATTHGKRLAVSTSMPSDAVVCGVVLDTGDICKSAPFKGRRRCAAHKGMHARSKVSLVNRK